MEERAYLMKNDILIVGQEKWLVLQNIDGYILIIKLETTKLVLKKIWSDDIIYKIIRKEVLLELNQNSTNIILDINSLPMKQQERFERSKRLCELIVEYYPNLNWLLVCNERADAIRLFAQTLNISEYTVRRQMLCFLQGGMTPSALLPKYNNCGSADKRNYLNRKTGPRGRSTIIRDEKLEKIFTVMTSKYMARGAKTPVSKLYNEMIYEFYSDKKSVGTETFYIPYPASLRPTIKQLRYWIKTHTDEVDREVRRIGEKVARNNVRPLFSDSIAFLNVKTIGAKYEMDEVETDFWLVNRLDRNRPIGRAIVYFIVDVFSRAIVACGIGLDNNSWSGAEIALLNLVENKKEFCSRYGIEIDEIKWPMKEAIPNSIIVDNGAEYLSDNLFEMAREVGLSIDFAPPRMGSFKPNVEQKFRQMNSLLKNDLPGEIEKDIYGQPHVRKACLDIYQFSQAVIHFIIEYNNNPIDNYPESKDMFEKQLILTPVNIWNYSLLRYNELTYVNDIESYKYSLLKRTTASITRNGIEYKGRYFICLNIDWLSKEMSKAAIKGHKKKLFKIRYDIRHPDIIYFEKDKKRNMAFLNCPEVIDRMGIELPVNVKTLNSKYAGLTEPEIEDVNESKKLRKLENEEIKLKNRVNSKSKINSIIKEASLLHKGVNKVIDIEKNRSEEKQNLHIEHHIVMDKDIAFSNQESYEVSTSISDNFEDKEAFSNMTRVEKIRWKEQQRIRKLNNE